MCRLAFRCCWTHGSGIFLLQASLEVRGRIKTQGGKKKEPRLHLERRLMSTWRGRCCVDSMLNIASMGLHQMKGRASYLRCATGVWKGYCMFCGGIWDCNSALENTTRWAWQNSDRRGTLFSYALNGAYISSMSSLEGGGRADAHACAQCGVIIG